MGREVEVFKALEDIYYKKNEGVTAGEVAEQLEYDRSHISRILNSLCQQSVCRKKKSRPVLFFPIENLESSSLSLSTENQIVTNNLNKLDKKYSKLKINKQNHMCINQENSLDHFACLNPSLSSQIEQGKAAILYPPHGMHTLLLGKTGVGKSMFAKLLYEYGVDTGKFAKNTSFIEFNCADYANNPQLLVGALFGVVKGAYTGAEHDKIGMLEQADGGILFLDEIHRLPPEGQEMLFTFIDKGIFKPLGEMEKVHSAQVMIIGATTEEKDSLLETMTRRLPMVIYLPSLKRRSVEERLQLFDIFVMKEVNKLNAPISISINSIKAFLSYDCVGNVGQLQADICVVLAKTYADFLTGKKQSMVVTSADLPEFIRNGLLSDVHHRKMWHLLDQIHTRFYSYEPQKQLLSTQKNIYMELKQKYQELEEKNISIEEIQHAMELDWNAYFETYDFKQKNQNLLSFVPEKIITVVNQIVAFSEDQLNRTLSKKVIQAMIIHIYNMTERIKKRCDTVISSSKRVYDTKLTYPELWNVALKCKEMLETGLQIKISDQEIDYLTLFFSYDYLQEVQPVRQVQVIVIAHGSHTATALTNTAKALLKDNHCILGIDASLDQNPQQVLDELKNVIRQQKYYSDVLLLVDMGSLLNFADVLEQEFKIKARAIPLVSTMHVLEAGRKAMLDYSLEEVYRDTLAVNNYAHTATNDLRKSKLVENSNQTNSRFIAENKRKNLALKTKESAKVQLSHNSSIYKNEVFGLKNNIFEKSINSNLNILIDTEQQQKRLQFFTKNGINKYYMLIQSFLFTQKISAVAQLSLLNVSLKKWSSAFFVFIAAQQLISLEKSKPLAIITMCLTGEGTAEMIKQILNQEFQLTKQDIVVLPIQLAEAESVAYKIGQIKQQYRIICVVSSLPIVTDLPTYDLYHVLNQKGLAEIKKQIDQELVYQQMEHTIKKYTTFPFVEILVHRIYAFNEQVEQVFNRQVASDLLIGFSFHLVGVFINKADCVFSEFQVQEIRKKEALRFQQLDFWFHFYFDIPLFKLSEAMVNQSIYVYLTKI